MTVRRLAILAAATCLLATTGACGKKSEGDKAAEGDKAESDKAAEGDKPAEGQEKPEAGKAVQDEPVEGDEPAAPAASGADQTTRQGLIDAAIAAIQSGKPEAYVALMGDLPLMKEACPEMMAKMAERGMDDAKLQKQLDKERERAAKGVAECAELDWEGAKQVNVEGGEKKRDTPEKGCTDIFELKDVRVTFELADQRTVQVKIDDPFTRGDKHFGVMGAPRCRVQGGEEPGGEETAPPPPP